MGWWTKFYKNEEEVTNGWVCNECDHRNGKATPYCPYCGEKMKARISNPTFTSVDDFVDASDWRDWIDHPTQEIYDIYWNWCIKEELPIENKINFMKQVLNMIPDLKSSPMKGKRYFREQPYF